MYPDCRNIAPLPSLKFYRPEPASWCLFLVAGIAQVFWTLPTVRTWGRIWNYVGIGGTIILIIIWTITRYPDNPISGRGLPVNSIGVAIEVFQIAFIVLCAVMIARDTRTKGVNKKQ
jgi:L-lactate permease